MCNRISARIFELTSVLGDCLIHFDRQSLDVRIAKTVMNVCEEIRGRTP